MFLNFHTGTSNRGVINIKILMSNMVINNKSIRKLLVIGFLTGLCLGAVVYRIPLSYGVYITFSSLFVFIILRLYGVIPATISSVAVNVLAIFIFNSDIILILAPLEVLFVGMRFKLKTRNLFLSDLLYWIFLGCPFTALFFYLYTGELGIDGYTTVFNQAIIGLINVLLADILVSYVNVKRIIGRREALTIDFSMLLFHMTLVSVLGPFILFTFMSGWYVSQDLNDTIINTMDTKKTNIMEQLKRWDTKDLRKVRLNSPIQLKNIKKIIDMDHENNMLEIMILDSNSNIYTANKHAQKYGKSYNQQKNWRVSKLNGNVYLWFPPAKSSISEVSSWKQAFFIETIKFEDIDLNLIIKMPLVYYTENMWKGYKYKFLIIIVSCLIATVLSMLTSRFLSSSLSRLAYSSTGIPDKLRRQEKIDWPSTSISQIRSLISNFREMSDKLGELFKEEKQMNKKLLDQTLELKKSREKLKHLAYYDALTDLPNRLYFINHLDEIIKKERNSNKIIAVMFIDLNRFKQINDSLGHEVGDTVLIEIAKRLNMYAKNDSFAARLGGDEFVVIMEDTDKEKVTVAALHINKILSDKITVNFKDKEIDLFVSGSIGISMYPMDANDIRTVLRNADIAMYAAKESGGDTYRFYEEIDKDDKEEQLQLEMGLKKALERKEFSLYYQPQFDVKTGNVTAIEALLRWNHPKLGLILPSRFISMANNLELMDDIGYWVLKEACIQNNAWKEKGIINIRVTVNICADHFLNHDVVKTVQRVLDETGLKAEILGLDVTESFLLKNIKNLSNILNELKMLGVYISIDDFGEGGSSLSILKEVPIDCIKIDKNFIDKISFDKKNALIVKAIIDLAHSMDIKVVAEGIETMENIKKLKELGCDDMHGFLLGAPMGGKDLENWLLDYKVKPKNSSYF